MTLPPEVMKELIGMFQIDVKEQLETITQSLSQLSAKAPDPQLLNDAMRGAHNIKGAARGIGVNDVQEIAHALEKLFVSLTNDQSGYNDEVKYLALESVSAIEMGTKAFIEQSTLPFDKAELIQRLRAISDDQ